MTSFRKTLTFCCIFFLCCHPLFLVTTEASTPNAEAKKEASSPPKRATSLDESFFGDVDIEGIMESHRQAMKNSFFSSSPEPTLDSKSQMKQPNDSLREEEDRRRIEKAPPPSVDQKNKEKGETISNKPPPPQLITSYETGQKFDCPKRTLWAYKLIAKSFLNKIEKLSSELTITDSNQYHLQLTITREEAHQLKRHFESFKSLKSNFKHSETKESSQEELEPEKANRFCRNLDVIEQPIVGLIERIKMPGQIKPTTTTTKVSFWLISSLNSLLSLKGAFFAVVLLICGLIGYLFFAPQVPCQLKITLAIVFLILGFSLVQFFIQERDKFYEEKQKKLDIVIDAALDCRFTEKMANFIWFKGYHCKTFSRDPKDAQGSYQLPKNLHETDIDVLFWRQFNIVTLLIKWIVWIFMLGPIKEVSLEVDSIFEAMVDGKTSTNWWDVGSYFRSMLFSNLTKPLWAIAILVIVFKLAPIFSFLAWTLRWMGWAMDRAETENVQGVPRDQGAIGVGSAAQPQINIVNNHYLHAPFVEPSAFAAFMANLPSAPQFPALHNQNSGDADEVYFSAEESED